MIKSQMRRESHTDETRNGNLAAASDKDYTKNTIHAAFGAVVKLEVSRGQ
jgi:hypothetical protein